MRYYRYAPSATFVIRQRKKDGSYEYYDLSADMTHLEVKLIEDGASEFSAIFANPNHKYNDTFLPMDQVVITASKDEPQKILTGYISSVTKLTLYERNFKITGYCPIYRMQRLYWDKGILGSSQLFASAVPGTEEADQFNGYANLIRRIIHNVGAIRYEDILIADIPLEAQNWARLMFSERDKERGQSAEMVQELIKVLKSSGGPLSSYRGTNAASPTYTPAGGTATSADVERMVSWMYDFTLDQSHGYSMSNRTLPDVDCSSFVWYALINNGWPQLEELCGYNSPFYTGNMMDYLRQIGWSVYGYTGEADLRRGDILWVHEEGGRQHTEVYYGNGQLVGAHHDIDGYSGDSTGDEVSVTGFFEDGWMAYARYEA